MFLISTRTFFPVLSPQKYIRRFQQKVVEVKKSLYPEQKYAAVFVILSNPGWLEFDSYSSGDGLNICQGFIEEDFIAIHENDIRK